MKNSRHLSLNWFRFVAIINPQNLSWRVGFILGFQHFFYVTHFSIYEGFCSLAAGIMLMSLDFLFIPSSPTPAFVNLVFFLLPAGYMNGPN